MQETPLVTDTPQEDFGKRVKSAVIWRSGTQILSQLLSWGTTLAVIHILSPGDYGLFAMTTVVLAFMTFMSGYGFVSAIVQSESVDPNRVRQAFGLLILLNGTLALVQFLIVAPSAAAYYREPMVADLLRWQSLIYLSTPFIALPEALMTRELEFRKLAIVNMSTAADRGYIVAIYGTARLWCLDFGRNAHCPVLDPCGASGLFDAILR